VDNFFKTIYMIHYFLFHLVQYMYLVTSCLFTHNLGILMVVIVKIKMSWNVTCNLVDKYQHFGGTCCLQLQGTRATLTSPLFSVYQKWNG
jgi:hypothetical protein